ncbi:MAG TPA: response regulator [Vicinamibacterales bacterium]|nr:response regulator [Vicinamibacterales bacterium]
MSPAALVVDSDPVQLALTARTLTDLSYDVMTASTFEDATRQILTTPALSLLISDVRLGEFNGIHLALRARSRHPKVLIIVTHESVDPTLEFETKQLSAAYVVKPVTTTQLTNAISYLSHVTGAATGNRVRRWPRKQVERAVRASVNDRDALLRDISYGGFCVELPQGDPGSLPSTIEVFVPTFGLSLKAHPVWTRSAEPSATLLCGSEVVENDEQTLALWHQFVDGCPA